MKSLHILLSILGLGILVSCKKSGYETRDGSVYYKDYRLGEADYASFEALNDVFAKDSRPITGAFPLQAQMGLVSAPSTTIMARIKP